MNVLRGFMDYDIFGSSGYECCGHWFISFHTGSDMLENRHFYHFTGSWIAVLNHMFSVSSRKYNGNATEIKAIQI